MWLGFLVAKPKPLRLQPLRRKISRTPAGSTLSQKTSSMNRRQSSIIIIIDTSQLSFACSYIEHCSDCSTPGVFIAICTYQRLCRPLTPRSPSAWRPLLQRPGEIDGDSVQSVCSRCQKMIPLGLWRIYRQIEIQLRIIFTNRNGKQNKY